VGAGGFGDFEFAERQAGKSSDSGEAVAVCAIGCAFDDLMGVARSLGRSSHCRSFLREEHPSNARCCSPLDSVFASNAQGSVALHLAWAPKTFGVYEASLDLASVEADYCSRASHYAFVPDFESSLSSLEDWIG